MSLAEQLAGVRLRTSTKPMRDFSDPKLAGFMKAEDVDAYQSQVLEVNTERWLDSIQELTFPSSYCPVSLEEVQVFIRVYEKAFKDKDPNAAATTDWRASLRSEDSKLLENLTSRLREQLQSYLARDGVVFVKTSCRSAKDAPVYQDRFKDLYDAELSKVAEGKRMMENEQITCLLKAAFQALKVRSAEEAIDMFMSSERIYQDFLLAVEQKDKFEENFIIRQFVEIDIDMEFRGFVFDGELTALSQYNYLIHSQRLCDEKEKVKNLMVDFFNEEVRPQLKGVPDKYIIDFAICDLDTSPKLYVIELNPFLTTTDAALFSWEHERRLLQGQDGFHFRITLRPEPGAKVRLPHGIRQMIK